MAFRWPSFAPPPWYDIDFGTEREIFRFAWHPMACSDHHTYWFRRIRIVQVWTYRATECDHWAIKSKMPVAKIPTARWLEDREND